MNNATVWNKLLRATGYGFVRFLLVCLVIAAAVVLAYGFCWLFATHPLTILAAIAGALLVILIHDEYMDL